MIEQLRIDDVFEEPVQAKKSDKQKIHKKLLKKEKDIELVIGNYIRTNANEIYRISRLTNKPRKVYCGHRNCYTREGKQYVKPYYKNVYDVWVELDNHGKTYEHVIYYENIVCQHKYILHCFCNGDFVKLKNGSIVKVIGWKKGRIKEKEYFINDGKNVIKRKQEYDTSVLVCEKNNRILYVKNDDILRIEDLKSDIDLLCGGDIVDTIFLGICVVLSVNDKRLLVKQLYPSVEDKPITKFMDKSEVKEILDMQEE